MRRTLPRLTLLLVVFGWSLLGLVSACDAQPRSPTPPHAQASPPSPPSPPTKPTVDPVVARVLGRWQSQTVCLELFANGDFELTHNQLGDGPKILIMGRASLTRDAKGVTLAALTTERIWSARWTSPCRKNHETGHFIDTHDLLGASFAPGQTVSLALKPGAEDTLEACVGATCATLARDSPALTAQWRRDGLDIPDRPARPWKPGELLEIDTDTTSAHLWFGTTDTAFGRARGTLETTRTGPDRFEVRLRVSAFEDAPDDGSASVLGVPLVLDQTTVLQARRLSGQRLEVCGKPKRCATLERRFDAYNHELD